MPAEPVKALVSDLSHDGMGVIKVNQRVYFVPGVLPGEMVEFIPHRKRRGKFSGHMLSILTPSPDREEPVCEYFGTCGGCNLQHMDAAKQVETKQKILFDNLNRIGRVAPDVSMAPISAEQWNYRRKARPGCKYVPKKGGILVGFREQGSSYLTSLRHCSTLDPRLSRLLNPLHGLVAAMSCYNQIPQFEIAAADNAVALVMRHLSPLNVQDQQLLIEFAQAHDVQLFLQSGGVKTVAPLWPKNPESLYYRLPDFDLTLEFVPSDFIQVNARVNQATINQALELLDPLTGDRVLDLFCGLGNFTLPIALSGARVLGVEGEQLLVNRAISNAILNGISNAEFRLLNLYEELSLVSFDTDFNKVLLDPPRSGALEVVTKIIPKMMPEKIVYISCNPSTLARDAEVLVHQYGYRLTHAGVIDMFPNTAHIESMGVFIRG